jgi:putative spermidine/putrescine transport system permease protein
MISAPTQVADGEGGRGVPIVFPGMIAVALFGFTLSYDEFPRSWLTVGSKNTLPLEIWTMTTNVTSPALYALGTVTTASPSW